MATRTLDPKKWYEMDKSWGTVFTGEAGSTHLPQYTQLSYCCRVGESGKLRFRVREGKYRGKTFLVTDEEAEKLIREMR